MESQMVLNSRGKIVFTFNKFFYQGQDRFPSSSPKIKSHSTNLLSRSRQIFLKLTKIKSRSTYFLSRSRRILIKLSNKKLTYSTNFNSTPREYCVKLKKWAFLSTKGFSQFRESFHLDPIFPSYPRTRPGRVGTGSVAWLRPERLWRRLGQAPIAITFNVANPRIKINGTLSTTTQTLSTKCFPTMQ